MADRHAQQQSGFALAFFATCLVVFGVAGSLGCALVEWNKHSLVERQVGFPLVFWISSALLIVGSISLQRALEFVRVEKQQPFRKSLMMSLLAGTLFVGFQSSGMWQMVQNQRPEDVPTGSNAFALVLVALHGIHFTVALLFVVFVTLKGYCDRYDHEYYWGVTVCAFFWHVLGIVWVAILGVFAIAL